MMMHIKAVCIHILFSLVARYYENAKEGIIMYKVNIVFLLSTYSGVPPF